MGVLNGSCKESPGNITCQIVYPFLGKGRHYVCDQDLTLPSNIRISEHYCILRLIQEVTKCSCLQEVKLTQHVARIMILRITSRITLKSKSREKIHYLVSKRQENFMTIKHKPRKISQLTALRHCHKES